MSFMLEWSARHFDKWNQTLCWLYHTCIRHTMVHNMSGSKCLTMCTRQLIRRKNEGASERNGNKYLFRNDSLWNLFWKCEHFLRFTLSQICHWNDSLWNRSIATCMRLGKTLSKRILSLCRYLLREILQFQRLSNRSWFNSFKEWMQLNRRQLKLKGNSKFQPFVENAHSSNALYPSYSCVDSESTLFQLRQTQSITSSLEYLWRWQKL